MFTKYVEKRKSQSEDEVKRVAEHVFNEEIGRYRLNDVFGIPAAQFTPEMAEYFQAFIRLVIEKNVAGFLRRRLIKSKILVGQEETVYRNMCYASHEGPYNFNVNRIVHESLHALVGLMRSSNKRRMQAITPEFARKKPLLQDLVSEIFELPTPQVALQLRDEVIIAEFADRTYKPANGVTPGLTATGPVAVKEYVMKRIKEFNSTDPGVWSSLAAHVIAASPRQDPTFYKIMTEIAESNGRDPYILYRIFMREAKEFLATFAPEVSKPVLPVTRQ